MNARRIERQTALKDKLYAAYGGYKCACCGETEPKFLSFDHIENNGCKMRKNGQPLGGESFYLWLIRNDFPKDYQVLCMNCNHGKSRNGGICPHKSRKV